MTYTCFEKLYGLKLYRGEITEQKIPKKHRDGAIAYAAELTTANEK